MTDFPTQSEPVSGLERGAIELSERYVRGELSAAVDCGIQGRGVGRDGRLSRN